MAVSLEGDAEPRAGASKVLRIAQEALQNTVRHAGATRDGPPRPDHGHLRLAVADDGGGFDPERGCARAGSA